MGVVYGARDLSLRRPRDSPRARCGRQTGNGSPTRARRVQVAAGGGRYRFLPDGKGPVLMLGWLLDPASGRQRQLTNLKPGHVTRSFDVSPDGKQILFDRVEEHSDVVLIELPERGK